MARQLAIHEQIGDVSVSYIRPKAKDAPVYSDGKGEDRLYLEYKRNRNYTGHQGDESFGSWVEEYHLSPVRHNLLKWFPFKANSTLLEVGAGCGALTGLLCEKSDKVTALEYSRQRALITAMRHSQRPNLEVIVGGLQDYETDQKFDYITLIGVLEYAGAFYGGEEPHQSFLTKLRGMLKPQGILILAIENKIGLKYICGAQEDHTGRLYESIYGYPNSPKVSTFSKKELMGLLTVVGFGRLEWYYPYPDYKMPQEVLSENIVLKDPDSIWRLFPARTGRQQRKEIISEKRFGRILAQAGLFDEFANSFLVVAGTEDIPTKYRCLRFTGANRGRKKEFRTNKQICQNHQAKQFILSPDNEDSISFLAKVAEREVLAESYFGSEAEVIRGRFEGNTLIYPYVFLPTMAELIAKAIGDGDDSYGKFWLDLYIQFLGKLPSHTCNPQEFLRELGISPREITESMPCLSCGILDCVPHNILVDTQKSTYFIIDNEFTYTFPIPKDFLIWRGVHTLVVDLQDLIQSRVSEERPVALLRGHGRNRHYIPIRWLEVLTNLQISPRKLSNWSSAFQNRINQHKTMLRSRLKANPKRLTRVTISELQEHQGCRKRIHNVLRKLKRSLRR